MKKQHHRFIIRSKNSDGIMTGTNTEVFMDGEKLRFVKEFNLNLTAAGVAEITLKMAGEVDFEGNSYVIGELESVK